MHTNNNITKIAIVGRPNVGKSSLFNRIVNKRKAIVQEASGTTRDRLYAEVGWNDKHFLLIDTGGFQEIKNNIMTDLIVKQLDKAIEEANLLLFVVDGLAGVTAQDLELAKKLRKTSKRIFLVVNKVDKENAQNSSFDFFELGLGEPYQISAMHNYGIQRLMDSVTKDLEKSSLTLPKEIIKIAIVGRPNVGKSSYLNTLLNEERVIVHPTAGTTRDSIDTYFNFGEKNYLLIDTAGIRHLRKVKEATDYYATIRTKEAISRCDIAMLIIDGYDGLREDDKKIMDLVFEEKKGLIIVVNKWDLVKNYEMSKYREKILSKMGNMANFPIIFISCKTDRNVKSTLNIINSVYDNYTRKIAAHDLNETLNKLNRSYELMRKNLRFGYATQSSSNPPKFIFIVEKIKLVDRKLVSYIENFLRKTYDLTGTPIKIEFKEKKT